MTQVRKKSISRILEAVSYLPNRTPEMSIEGGAEDAFALLSDYRDGAIFVGHYSGDSEWERHSNGDEIVMVLKGKTTIVLRAEDNDEQIEMESDDIVVVPKDTWHRFQDSADLKVLTVTPQPTEHSVKEPGVVKRENTRSIGQNTE